MCNHYSLSEGHIVVREGVPCPSSPSFYSLDFRTNCPRYASCHLPSVESEVKKMSRSRPRACFTAAERVIGTMHSSHPGATGKIANRFPSRPEELIGGKRSKLIDKTNNAAGISWLNAVMLPPPIIGIHTKAGNGPFFRCSC